MITWKIPVFCCFTKKPGTNRSFFRIFIACILVYCRYFWLFIEKNTQFLIFSVFTGQKTTCLLHFPLFEFHHFAQFHALFSKLYSLRFSYFLMVDLVVHPFSCYNKCQKTNALMQLANKDYAPSSFSNDKAYRRTPYVSQKDP